jgi:hypothetical protein
VPAAAATTGSMAAAAPRINVLAPQLLLRL